VVAKSAPSSKPLIELLEIIKSEINRRGAISFEQFMRLALYCPVYGYYEKEKDRIGKNGDFYTSVSVGKLFGELLAFQFAEWLLECQSETRPVQIVEAGAHTGELAKDILTWFRDHCPGIYPHLQYVIIEPSAVRQKWQNVTLAEFAQKVSWLSRNTDHASRIHGIIFANELFDAMPVRRFGWDVEKRAWFEWAVTLKSGELAWTNLDHGRRGDFEPTPRHFGDYKPPFPPFEISEDLLSVLPNNFTFETCPESHAWWENAARALESGKLMTIDYGMTADWLISPERQNGTLRGYYRHHSTRDLLANPGEQDLTAHVNFSTLIAAGEASGLKTQQFETQAQFLTKIVSRAKKEGPADWSASRARQFQTLTHPDHLGRFRVLIQSRQTAAAP
jgi:SAM-dependent MidA family methyltransferase